MAYIDGQRTPQRPADDVAPVGNAGGDDKKTGGAAVKAAPVGSANNNTLRTVNVDPGTNWVLPVAGMASEPGANWSRGSFGYQKPASKGGHIHQGVDIYAARGTAILAPVSGTVISVGTGKIGGNYIKIRGIDGIEYYFAHMDAESPWERGAKVNAGIYLGAVGNSGNAAGTSTHLHFSMKKNGTAVSPNDFLSTGQQQQHTPLSSIPGLNTPEEIAAWAQEEFRRQSGFYDAQQAGLQQQGMGGFDVGGIAGRIYEGQEGPNMEGFGQRFLGSTLSAFANRQAGGERVPIPKGGDSSALGGNSSALEGEALTPSETHGVPVEEAVNPALQRQEVGESDDQV